MMVAGRFDTERILRWFGVGFTRAPSVTVLHAPANKACEATRGTFIGGLGLHWSRLHCDVSLSKSHNQMRCLFIVSPAVVATDTQSSPLDTEPRGIAHRMQIALWADRDS